MSHADAGEQRRTRLDRLDDRLGCDRTGGDRRDVLFETEKEVAVRSQRERIFALADPRKLGLAHHLDGDESLEPGEVERNRLRLA